MFQALKNIPEKYKNAFIAESIRLIKSRAKLGVWIFLPTYIIGSAIGNFLIIGKIAPQLVYTWIFLTILSSIVLVLIRYVKGIHAVRITAILFLVAILFSIIRFQILQGFPPFHTAVTCIITLFASTFIIPWLPTDILTIGFLHIFFFVLYFLNVPQYTFKNIVFLRDSSDFFQGAIAISIVSVICFIVNKTNFERHIENFVLYKENETKNDQMQQELKLATRVHNRLIPCSERTALADIAVTYLPMLFIGGDYAKFRMLGPDKLLFIISDVTGHGVSAALLVNAFHVEFERMITKAESPGILLKELDKFIVKDFGETNMFLSAFCGLLDFSSMKFRYSNYGHPPQYIYRTVDSSIERVHAQTTFLGLHDEDESIYENEISFNNGDQILLFTDGVVEAANTEQELYGNQRLENIVKKHHGLDVELFNQYLISDLNTFSHNSFNDDVFLLNIKVK